MWAAAASAILLVGSLGPLGAPVGAAEPKAKPAEDVSQARPDGRVVEVAPAPITVPAGGSGPAPDSSIGGPPLFLPYTPPADTIEVAEKRTERSRTLANPDGTFTTELSNGPLNYLDPAGTWQPIDLSLVGDDVTGYRVAATAGDVRLGGADGSFGSIELGGHRVSISPMSFLAGLKGEGADANRVTFDSLPGEPSLWIRPIDIGLEFGATWISASTRPSVSLRLDAGDLIASLATDGRTVVFADEKGTFVGRIDQPILREKDMDGPPFLEQVSVSLEAEDSGGYRLTYSVDPEWFGAKERQFPLILDPSFCLGEGSATAGCDFNNQSATSFDTFVFNDGVDNYESGWTTIRTGYDVRSDDGSVYGAMRSILYFPPVTLPDGAVIYDASLRTRVCCLYGSAQGQTVWAYRLTKALSTQYTWTKFGNAFTTTGGASSTVPASGFMYWDLHEIVQSWYTRRAKDYKAPFGILLKMANEGSAYGEVEYRRYNYGTAAYRPLLQFSYTVPAVGIDFDPRLGSTYAPSTMVAGQATKLPIIVTNRTGSAHVLDRCAEGADPDCWLVGYRWFDAKGNLVGGGNDASLTDLPAATSPIAVGATSGVFTMLVTPPATVGQYTLRLDLVHRAEAVRGWASDGATPSLYYSRNKKVLTSSSTRWTGSSKIERDEFSINVTAGASGANVPSVDASSGGTIGIDLNSKNLALNAPTGLGFDDRVPLSLSYTYNEALAELCAGYQGILGACGWSTNWDERITGGANRTGFDYTYLDPHGVPAMLDTDESGQIAGGASVLVNRQRVTILDENSGWDGSDGNGAPDILAVNAGVEGIPGGAFSGQNVAKVPSNTTLAVNAPDLASLNTYRLVRFAIRTTSATKAGICFKVHNLTDTSFADQWFCYTVGSSDWATGNPQEFVSGTIVNAWKLVDQDLFYDVRTNGGFGAQTDDYQVTAIQVQSSSPSNSGSTYVDGFRFESADSTMFNDSSPAWTNPTGYAGTSSDAVVGAASLKFTPGQVGPICTLSTCWQPSWGETWFNPFADWYWKKAGGTSAAMVFYVHDERTGAPCNTGNDCTLTYYAGATPGITLTGAANAMIRIADTAPTTWTLVRRNVLEDARQALNLFDDAGSGAGDLVRIRGYAPLAVDGGYLLVDRFGYGQLADVGAIDPTGLTGQQSHPSSAGDAVFTYDFTADYADGSRHYFNRDGLLTRIRDRDGQQVSLDWSVDPSTAGPTAYTLTAIRAPGDATGSGGTTFDRQFTISRGTDGSLSTIRFDEDLGATSSDSSNRAAIFETSSPASTSFSGGPSTATAGVNGNRTWLGNVFYPKAGTTVSITGTLSGGTRSVGILCPEGGAADINVYPATTSPFNLTVPPGGHDGCRAYIWVPSSNSTLSGWQVSYTQAGGNLVKVSQARHAVSAGASGTFCGTRPNGCVEYTYTDTTNHRLATVVDPRWDGATSGAADSRLEVARSGNDPISIKDRSHGGATLLNILSFSDPRTTLPYTRALWQDAAAAASAAAIATDLNPDGATLTQFVPRPCAQGSCGAYGNTANWPDAATQPNYKGADFEFDGLSRITTVKTYRCPVAADATAGCAGGQLITLTRSETNAAAKVDNYADPLAGGRIAWRATADQVFASLRDSSGTNPDWYRTEYAYDGSGQVAETIEVRQLESSNYADVVKSNAPAGYWRLNEASGTTMSDSSGFNRSGSYAASPTLGQTGSLVRDAANRSVTFNGTTQSASIPGAAMGTISGSFTVEAWLNQATLTTSAQAFVGSRGSSDYGFDIKLCPSTCSQGKGIRIDVGSGTAWLVTATVPWDWQTGRWYHVVAVVEGARNRVTVYVDGAIIGALTLSTGTPLLTNATHNLYIGQNGLASPPEWFNGRIDEVAVYPSALQPADIAAHFRAGRAVATVDTTVQRDNAGRPTETATSFTRNPGFEQSSDAWALGSGASVDTTSAPNSGSAALATSIAATTQIAQLVPGQTLRFQFATKAAAGTNVHAKFEYWRTSGTPAWQQFGVDTDFGDTTWAGHAYDITLPMATDGRVRVSFSRSGGGAGWVDDVLLVTAWAKVAYDQTAGLTFGLPTDTTTLATCLVGPCAAGTVTTRLAYTASTSSPDFHPAIFPTATIANYVDGTQGPGPEEDATTQVSYDAWGRALVTIDPDLVASTVAFAPNQTDLIQTRDGLGNATTMTYDAVGNTLTTTTPLGRTMSSTYDARNHVLTSTAPDGVVSRTDYDNYGRMTASWANYVNGVVESSDGDLADDLLTTYAYDAWGRVTRTDVECGSVAACATGGLDARTTTTYDLLGNAVTTTTYPGAGGTGTARTTTNHFETYDPTAGEFAGAGVFSRSVSSGVVAAIAPTATPAPLCPESGTSTRCNSVSTLDLSGRAILVTDAYGIVTRTRYDIAGKTVESTANYVAGQSGTSDRNVVTTTQYDLAGNPAVTWDALNRRDVRTYDVLGRLLAIDRVDSTSPGNVYLTESTAYTPAGRVAASFDGSSWTSTRYDGAGRATQTVANDDPTGSTTRMVLDAFEAGTGDWASTPSGSFTVSSSAGLTTDTDAAGNAYSTVPPVSGRGRLRITTSATNGYNGAWLDLSGPTYVAGHTYNAVFDLAASAAGLSLSAHFGQDVAGGSYGSLAITSTTNWARYTVSWTASSSTSTPIHLAVRKLTSGTSELYLDNLVIWDATPGFADDGITSSATAYDADGEIIASVLPPGDPATERPLVTTTGFDRAGRTVITTVNGASGAYAASVLGTAGLAAYVPLDERLGAPYADRKAGATALTVAGSAPTPAIAGGIDEARTAASFGGSGYLTRSSNATSAVTNVSMEAWIRTDAGNPASTLVVAANGTQANGWGIGLDSSGNAAGVAISGSTLTTMSSSEKVNDGAWHHLVLTRTGSTWSMTVDNAPKTLSNNTTNPGTPGAGFSIGALSDGTRAFTGEIDELSVYTADISGSTATAHWAAGRQADTVTGLTSRTAFDRLGRATDAWGPDLVRTRTGYDRLGNQVETIANYRDGSTTGGTAADDVRSTFAYDVLGELTGYCPAVQVASVGSCAPATGSEPKAWHYEFDALGRQTRTIPPDNTAITDLTTEEVVYQPGGRVDRTCRYPAGGSCGMYSSRHTDFTYDNLGRALTQKTWDRGASPAADTLKFTKTFTWEPDGSPKTVNEGSDTLTYVYDAAGRLSQLKRGATVLTAYTYTTSTNLIASRIDGTQGTVAFTWDWAGRQTVIDPPDSYVAGTVSRTYRLDGLLATQSFPGSITETLTYDAAKRPISISLGAAGSLSQSFDRAGSVTTDGRSLAGIAGDAGANTQSFSYDALHRLTGSTGLAASRSYQYDLDGNRTRRVEGAVTTDYAYDRADQLQSQTIGATTKTFTYDPYGNLLDSVDATSTSTWYLYDEASRLTGIFPPGGAPTAIGFTLDALDRPATRTTGGSTTDTYAYLDATETAYLTGQATTTGSLLDAEGTRLAVKTGSQVSWLVFDLHGSVAAVCPAGSTTLTDAYRYDGWGVQVASSGSVTNPYRYRGLLNLANDTGAGALLAMAAREYSPQLGTFTQEDGVAGSAANPATMNRFLYALANPATLIDPDGHRACLDDDSGRCVAEPDTDMLSTTRQATASKPTSCATTCVSALDVRVETGGWILGVDSTLLDPIQFEQLNMCQVSGRPTGDFAGGPCTWWWDTYDKLLALDGSDPVGNVWLGELSLAIVGETIKKYGDQLTDIGSVNLRISLTMDARQMYALEQVGGSGARFNLSIFQTSTGRLISRGAVVVGIGVDAITSFAKQWQKDEGRNLDPFNRLARSGTRATISAVGGLAGGAAGAGLTFLLCEGASGGFATAGCVALGIALIGGGSWAGAESFDAGAAWGIEVIDYANGELR